MSLAVRHQPIPEVTLLDVERIVRRDFPEAQFDSVIAVLEGYESNCERSRVQLATSKLARGSLDALRKHINTATQDFWDVIAAAEYPEYSKSGSRVRELPVAEQQQIIDSDWTQYQDWLRR